MKAGAEVNVKVAIQAYISYERTALMEASERGHVEIVKELLRAGEVNPKVKHEK